MGEGKGFGVSPVVAIFLAGVAAPVDCNWLAAPLCFKG